MGKNVLIVTKEIVPFYYGGIGTQFRAMANLLSSSGYLVRILTQKHESYSDRAFREHYPGCKVHFLETPKRNDIVDFSCTGGLISHYNLVYARAVHSCFDKLYSEHLPNYVISADYGAEVFFCLLRKQAGAYQDSTFVIFIEGSTFDSLKTYESGAIESASELDDPQNILTCAMENICVRSADQLVVPTKITWKQTQDRLGIDALPTIIPNLVGKDFFQNVSGSNERQQGRTLLFIGRLDIHKGADLLLEAFIIKYGDHADEGVPKLIFIGRDAFCKHYGEMFLAYWKERIPANLRRHIVFTGQVVPSVVKQHLSQTTLCVFPSRWEVFGIVCMEAMASGCPVAVSDHTGLAEVIGDEFNDFKICFDDATALFDLLDRLLVMDQSSYESLCDAFRQRAFKVAKSGNSELLQFFNTSRAQNHIVGKQSPQFNDDLTTCIEAVGRTASTLASDFNKMTDYYNLDDESVKKVLFSTKSEAECQKNKKFSLKRILDQFIKNRFPNII